MRQYLISAIIAAAVAGSIVAIFGVVEKQPEITFVPCTVPGANPGGPPCYVAMPKAQD